MFKTLAAALCLLLLTAVFAGAAEMKIAVFNVQTVTEKSNVLKDAKSSMDKTFSTEKSQLEKQRQDLERRATGLKEGDKDAAAALQKDQQAYSDRVGVYLRKIQAAEGQVRQQIEATLTKAAGEYAKKHGYTLILDAQSAPYFDSSYDVTNDMVVEVNRVWQEAKK